MRAAKSRGSRTRSPSLPNELIEKDSRHESPATPGFFFGRMLRRETISWRSRFLSGAVLPHTRCFRSRTPASVSQHRWSRSCEGAFEKSDHADTLPFKGYPVPLSTKKRDCLVAYSHSADEHFENAFCAMIKSKYFMTVLRAIVTNMTATWRFDSIRFFNLLLSSCETTLACARA
jgi:hypothetical protein